MKEQTHEGNEVRITNGSGHTEPDRRGLMRSNIQYQEALEDQLSGLKKDAESWMKGAAMIGGMIFVGYSIYKLFMEKEETEEVPVQENEAVLTPVPVQDKSESSVVRMIKESIALFLIGIAKQKIQEFLQNLESGHENGDAPPAQQ